MSNKPWLSPPDHPDYYEWLRSKKVNKPLRLIASTGASAVSQVINGRLIIDVPKATKEYRGRAIFSPVHRSGWDIPATVAAIAKAGFERPRPVSRQQNFPNRPVSWLMHSLGAGAVDRLNPSMKGIELAFGHFLEQDEVVKLYSEGTRIKEDVRVVHDVKPTALMLAAQHIGTSVIAMGIAGLASEDNKRPIGSSVPTVIAFSEPLEVPFAEGNRRASFTTARELTPLLYNMMQSAQDRAYEIRDEYLK
ncbi:hypothetical protein EB118_01910 [bacterium]|nr:hypothetical protein [bacterium]NBX97914.1 hypothetical protein [bacterium]NDC94305.1 hypothetical protein [bacterium]NDG28842.1 hypothetical protein [bacterium]